jgi:hypothetical protein
VEVLLMKRIGFILALLMMLPIFALVHVMAPR